MSRVAPKTENSGDPRKITQPHKHWWSRTQK